MKYTGKNIRIKDAASTQDAVDTILRLSRECAADPLARYIYDGLQHTSDPYNSICQFAYNTAFYEPNPPGHQRVRSLQRTIVDKRASCTDYTVMIAAILLAGGEPVQIKLVSIDGDGFGHIYPVAINGRVMDVVPYQDQSGNEFFLRENKKSLNFGREEPYKKHVTFKLQPMTLTELNGTNTINATNTLNGTNTINGLIDYETYEIDGCPCMAISGSLIPMEINGTMIETKPADVSAEDYDAYLLAVALGDPEAVQPVNGLKDFIQKRKDKKAARRDKRAQRKKSREDNKRVRQARREQRRQKFGSIVDTAQQFLQAKGENINAMTEQLLRDVEDAGIDPDDDSLRSMIEMGQRGDFAGEQSSNTPLLLGAAALAAFFLLRK